MVSEVGQLLLEAARRGYTVEILPDITSEGFDGLTFLVSDLSGRRRVMRGVSLAEFRSSCYDPVYYTIGALTSLMNVRTKKEGDYYELR